VSAALEVTEVRAEDYAAWEAFVASSPDGSAYALPEYLDALSTATGGGFRILAARRGGEIVAGLPLREWRRGALRAAGPRLLLYYMSPVFRAWESRYPSQRTSRHVEALTALAAAAEGQGYDSITLRCRPSVTDVRPLLARGWSAQPGFTYVAPLTDLEELRGRMEQNLRRLVDRCDRAGLTLTEDDDFPAFYRLHAEALLRQDQPPYLPEAAFRPFIRRLRERGLCRLFFARAPDGAPAAMQLVLTGPHPVTHTMCAGADAEYQKLGASAFLRWRVFEALAAAGHTANDLTDATLNRVTHFKSQLGADLAHCHVVTSPTTLRWRLAETREGAVRGARFLASMALGRAAREEE
jgi:CelD/BcsL family acetyltransferase involved in cellulose biosynthesis